MQPSPRLKWSLANGCCGLMEPVVGIQDQAVLVQLCSALRALSCAVVRSTYRAVGRTILPSMPGYWLEFLAPCTTVFLTFELKAIARW